MSDQDLVKEALATFSDYTGEEIEKASDGTISESTWIRWQNSEVHWIKRESRRWLKKQLGYPVPELSEDDLDDPGEGNGDEGAAAEG